MSVRSAPARSRSRGGWWLPSEPMPTIGTNSNSGDGVRESPACGAEGRRRVRGLGGVGGPAYHAPERVAAEAWIESGWVARAASSSRRVTSRRMCASFTCGTRAATGSESVPGGVPDEIGEPVQFHGARALRRGGRHPSAHRCAPRTPGPYFPSSSTFTTSYLSLPSSWIGW